ncbi:hypothetical protein MGYG_06344 [Nannizzia gypsea CBS 118893]|uniref:Uncharacterized protein n=1 Tax=Arthroderma gypseum (strain ATCC MYA-4604 / CBS 118893) TaxID=535722 RepID=E4UZ17_ARTGP|nr:hypothetical protein MGYG_06344 [Nannizzia gypsea CBS 118893]EFR03347.1 hypothetical protein MGYG_06344 [Nannizzia gypsea CBS 118893]
MNRRITGRDRRSEDRGHIPTNAFASSDAGSYSGSSSDIGSVRTASSVINGDDDEEVTLRRAFEESLRLEKDRQRQHREAEKEAMNREDEVRRQSLREAQEAERRAREAARAEEEAIRAALEASEREEAARVRRVREDLRSIEKRFGGGDAASNGHGSQENHERSSRDLRSTAPRSRRGHDAETQNTATRTAENQATRGRAQTPVDPREGRAIIVCSPRVREAMAWNSRAYLIRGSEQPSTPRKTVPSSSSSSASLASNPTRPAHPARSRSPSPQSSRRSRRRSSMPLHNRSPPTAEHNAINPAAYSLQDIVARSVRETWSGAPLTEATQESNDYQLQRAINESAEQHRDEDEEAVRRSRGIPTYEEACASVRYRPPPGMRYSFQGPDVIEVPRENGPPTKLKIVGDMDLGEAMSVANQRLKKRGMAQLN